MNGPHYTSTARGFDQTVTWEFGSTVYDITYKVSNAL